MTSFTRKLHKTSPAAAKAIHRIKYGRHPTLLSFTLSGRDAPLALSLGDRQDAEIEAEFRAARPRHEPRIEPDSYDPFRGKY